MTLPLAPPLEPMLAKPVPRVPPIDALTGGVAYEPKWDGFRCLVFRDGGDVVLQGRGGKDLAYCFPEIVAAVTESLPERVVLDGELVVAHDGRLWFEDLGQRIRPRSEAGGWKIRELSEQFPASFVGFDLLALGDEPLLDSPFSRRRAMLERVLAGTADPLHLTRTTGDDAEAARWFEVFEGAGLDGLVCKGLGTTYTPGQRTMLKVKHARTADCVVAGWRPYKQAGPDGRPVVGSLLLGLWSEDGRLRTSASPRRSRWRGGWHWWRSSRRTPWIDGEPHPWAEWADAAAHAGGRLPGAVSRWSGGKDLSFVPVRPELVVEVGYDQMEGSPAASHRAVQAVAARPGAVLVHVRPARASGEVPPRRRAGLKALGTKVLTWL